MEDDDLSRSSKSVLVVGAGLAGLAAAYTLRDEPHLLVESEARIGGLCRSVRGDGFTFDFTGHLLHMKRPDVRELVFSLLGEESFVRIERRSAVYSHGTVTDYPFQVNTHGLPKAVVRECVMGFAGTLGSGTDIGEDPSFARWALATFGEGICKHFMIPYNEKLFRTDLDSVTADWVSWSIPKPTWAEVVRGALGKSAKAFGYNANFLYPAGGGIDHLPNAFLPHLRSLRLSTAVVGIHAGRREAKLSNGEIVPYGAMISTIPLPRLLASLEDLPADLAEGGRRLRHVSVLNLNLGFDAPCPLPYQWLYFPEPEFPFYRIGVYSNLCAATVPEGASAFYVEISHRPGEAFDLRELESRVVDALHRVGLVPPSAHLLRAQTFHIPCGYVIHDRHRREFLPEAARYLEEQGILSVGRYGGWEYSAMEDALWQGKLAAERATA